MILRLGCRLHADQTLHMPGIRMFSGRPSLRCMSAILPFIADTVLHMKPLFTLLLVALATRPLTTKAQEALSCHRPVDVYPACVRITLAPSLDHVV